MREFHESHDGIATLAMKRVEDTSQFGVAIVGADGRIQGFQEKPDPAEALSDLANCGIYMFRKEIFDFFPEPGTSKAAGEGDPPGFADWAMDVFPRLLDGDVPFYSHEIDAYWNDIGNLEELREGNVDALTGAVEVEREGELVDGFRSGERMEGEPDLVGPVLLGPGCEIGDDVRIDGPSVIGDDVKVGDGARLKEVIALPGAEIPARSVLINAIAGARLSGSVARPLRSWREVARWLRSRPRHFRDRVLREFVLRATCALVARQGRGMELLPRIGVALVPALCAACGRSCRSEAVVCTRCGRRLAVRIRCWGTGRRGWTRSGLRPPMKGWRGIWSGR